MKVLVIGGKSGIGLGIANSARTEGHTVVVTDRERVDLTNEDSVRKLAADIRDRWAGELIVFNAYVRTNNDEAKAFAQANALPILWEEIRKLDTCFVVMSSTATYKAGPGANNPVYALYIRSKQQLNDSCIRLGFAKPADRKARMVLFEPGQMQKPQDGASSEKLTQAQVWGAITAAEKLRYAFMRIGGQA